MSRKTAIRNAIGWHLFYRFLCPVGSGLSLPYQMSRRQRTASWLTWPLKSHTQKNPLQNLPSSPSAHWSPTLVLQSATSRLAFSTCSANTGTASSNTSRNVATIAWKRWKQTIHGPLKKRNKSKMKRIQTATTHRHRCLNSRRIRLSVAAFSCYNTEIHGRPVWV